MLMKIMESLHNVLRQYFKTFDKEPHSVPHLAQGPYQMHKVLTPEDFLFFKAPLQVFFLLHTQNWTVMTQTDRPPLSTLSV